MRKQEVEEVTTMARRRWFRRRKLTVIHGLTELGLIVDAERFLKN